MELISCNVGLPRDVPWLGRVARTSIWKTPVEGRVRVSKLNLDGDRQADLSVHGGLDKAVYAYPSEHYSYWRRKLPGVELPWGAFGENFTTRGLVETRLEIGERLRVGSAELIVTQPRMPCFKLGIRFGDPGMVKRFLESGRTGFYLRVLQEGEVGAGDRIEHERDQGSGVTVADIANLYVSQPEDRTLLRRATEVPALPESWKEFFRRRL